MQRELPSEPKRVIVFFITAFLISWVVWISLILGRRQVLGYELPVFVAQSIGAYAPLLAVLIVRAVLPSAHDADDVLSPFTFKDASIRFVVLSIVIPPLIVIVANVLSSLLTGTSISFLNREVQQTLGLTGLLFLPIQFVAAIFASPLGEEPGWRGFALPRLRVLFGSTGSSLVLGVLWGVWHIPLLVLLGLPVDIYFLLGIVAHSFIIDALFLQSENLLIAMLYHQAINTSMTFFAGGIDTPMAVAVTWIVAIGVRLVARRRSVREHVFYQQ